MAASESLAAAQVALNDGHYRSATSRAYYSSYQAATAAFVSLGVMIPDRGNWSHLKLRRMFEIEEFRKAIKRPRPIEFKQALLECYFYRCDADYRPKTEVHERQSMQAIRWAGMMMAMARKVQND